MRYQMEALEKSTSNIWQCTKVKEASIEEIRQVEGIPNNIAEQILTFSPEIGILIQFKYND